MKLNHSWDNLVENLVTVLVLLGFGAGILFCIVGFGIYSLFVWLL